jgi:hypothetical protein
MRRLIGLAALTLALAAQAICAGAGSADGGPIDTSDGPGGVTAPRSDVRFHALGGDHETLVAQVRRNGGEVLRSLTLHGVFAIPGVGGDGSADGLAHDGRTLVLVQPRVTIARRHTVIAVLRAKDLRVSRMVRLRGDFSYDAMSPDGRSLYLIEYLSSNDPTRYAVRAYNVRAGRLEPKPIVDPNEHADEMRGYPLSRAYSPDGRWAYTLYDGNEKHPFVHALDTVAGRAKCIDTPMLAGRGDLYDLTLRPAPGGRTLSVTGAHGPVALVDTRTFRVTKPLPARATPGRESGGGSDTWPLVAFAALLLAGGAVALRLRRRRRLAPG